MDEQSEQNTSKKKSRIFFTAEPERRAAGWLMGTRSIQNTGRIFRDFQETMLHGDQKHSENTAYLPSSERSLLGKRLLLEAVIYMVIALILGIGSFWSGFSDFGSGEVNSAVFWLIMGFAAIFVGVWISIIKFWQKHNVENRSAISLREFLKNHF